MVELRKRDSRRMKILAKLLLTYYTQIIAFGFSLCTYIFLRVRDENYAIFLFSAFGVVINSRHKGHWLDRVSDCLAWFFWHSSPRACKAFFCNIVSHQITARLSLPFFFGFTTGVASTTISSCCAWITQLKLLVMISKLNLYLLRHEILFTSFFAIAL